MRSKYLKSTLNIVAIALIAAGGIASAAPTIRAAPNAEFWGEVSSGGQKSVCWRNHAVNAVGDFGGKSWYQPLKGGATVRDGCVPLYGDGSSNLYYSANPNDPAGRQALLVIANGGDGVNLGKNICREPHENGAKLYVTANPAKDKRCAGN